MVCSVIYVSETYATGDCGRLGPVVGGERGLEKVLGFKWGKCVTRGWSGERDVPKRERGDKP